MASEISASQTSPTPTPTSKTPCDFKDVDDVLMSSQRQRYLMALQEEQEQQGALGGQSDSPRPAR
jgi:hypothetical protein